MAAWRRRALEVFPELRHELNSKGEIFSVYALWFELLPLTRKAHRDGDDEFLARVYDFAEWSLAQGGDPSNAVAVSFYEHLVDEAWMRPLVAAWISQDAIGEVRGLWEASLAPEAMAEVDELLRTTRRHAPIGRKER